MPQELTMKGSATRMTMWLRWGLYGLVMVLAPMWFSGGGAIAVMSQMGSAILFGLAFNILLGQGGMLSFGHSVYYGLGCFFAVHAMNLAGKGFIWLPLPLVPLAGALAGMVFGALFGLITTQRSGTAFAMLTFGLGELVFLSASMFPNFFGGEVGLTTTRVYAPQLLGLTFGPAIQVYYLIALWVLVGTLAMYGLTLTPLGLLLNAVRDNAERVAFIGYNAQRIRFASLALSGLFSGLAGALAAINFESATIESLSAAQSGTVLVFTFIGGAGYFVGPIVGAIVGTMMTVLVSGITMAWPLYLGLFFVLVVKFAPGGIVGMLIDGWRYVQRGEVARNWRVLVVIMGVGLTCSLSAVTFIEMTYHLTMDTTGDASMVLAGIAINTASWILWVAVICVTAVTGAVTWNLSRLLKKT